MWWRRISSRSTSFHASSASVRTGSYNRRRELLWDRQSISTFVYVTTPGMYLPPWESPPLRWELGDVLVNTDGRIFHVPKRPKRSSSLCPRGKRDFILKTSLQLWSPHEPPTSRRGATVLSAISSKYLRPNGIPFTGTSRGTAGEPC